MASESVAFIPGHLPANPSPLGRFLPPLADGVVKEWLLNRLPIGAWIVDPFAASPRQTLEAARAGYRVLVAANNPISKFLIEIYAASPGPEMLRAALADLAADPRSEEKLEQQIRGLYKTECDQCSKTIDAQAFIWERQGTVLVSRIYTCPFCKSSGEYPAIASDLERAHHSSASGLHRARALERIAPVNDPDRVYAEEALEVYPPRAIDALVRLVNRLERMVGKRRWLASILVLAAFDQANALWHYPSSRFRPRQLNLPARYVEKNIWLALEAAVDGWPAAIREAPNGESSITCTEWPELPQNQGGVCIFRGRVKDLTAELTSNSSSNPNIQGVIAALPRPNQAFWTLSALWAGWLWGRASSADFRSVLRRRRYDWGWHLTALYSALSHLTPYLKAGEPILGLIGETEPGFISAALLAAEFAGLDLQGVALRSELEQAQIHWSKPLRKPQVPLRRPDLQISVKQGMVEYLVQRGEPASYLQIHTAANQAFVKSYPENTKSISSPSEAFRQLNDSIERLLTQENTFQQYGTTSHSIEVGQWWLRANEVSRSGFLTPLADIVEIKILQFLRMTTHCSLAEIDKELCRDLTGLLTPNLELVRECLQSYAEEDESGMGSWKLRPQDGADSRLSDIAQITALIQIIGIRLGYEVVAPKSSSESSATNVIIWKDPDGKMSYEFFLSSSGVLGRIVLVERSERNGHPIPSRQILVLPGGRAGLVEYKMRSDLRLRQEIMGRWMLVKFRHIRWLSEYKNLTKSNLEESLTLDPLANRDPQMSLL